MQKLHAGECYCQNVLVSFGKYGHYFDEPGIYRVCAFYQRLDDMLVASNIYEFRIGRPFSRKEEERDAQDFYSWEAGMALYVGGSDSPYLQSGMNCLRTLAEHYQKSPVGAQLSLVLAQNLSQPFRRVEEVGRQPIEMDGRQVTIIQKRRVEERPANPQEALKIVDRALQQHNSDDTTFNNITYHQASRTKATLLATMGKRDKAVNELDRLIQNLRERGVKDDILAEIEVYKQTLSEEKY